MKRENTPSYDEDEHILTLPEVSGVSWTINGDTVESGEHELEDDEVVEVEAHVGKGYVIDGDSKWTFSY